MKYIILITLSLLLCHCSNVKKSDKIQKAYTLENDFELENDVINQTIPLVIDSLRKQIDLNFKNIDSIHYIYYADSLFSQRYSFQKIQKIFLHYSILLDTVHFKDCTIKLHYKGSKLKGNKELSPLSSISSIEEMARKRNNKFVLLIFTRVNFSKDKKIAFFNVDLSCSLNAGREYAVLAKKENNNWMVMKITESAIR